MDQGTFSANFWGVRGTMPTAHPSVMRYGGNTSCVEVQCNGITFILDAGSGIVNLAHHLPNHAHLLLSHTHIDHIVGLCCMSKIFSPDFSMDIWAGHLLPECMVDEVLSQMISPPLFPIPIKAVAAQLNYHDFYAGSELFHKHFLDRGIQIYTYALQHPDRATAYRIAWNGKSLCYVTDVEHVTDELDESLIHFIRCSDVVIYDSTYDDSNFTPYIGWGHSTWQHALRIGEAAMVDKMVLFHHDPSSTDDILDQRAEYIEQHHAGRAIMAREGLTLILA
ncbi:MAG: MBL fold metallo-hydrolase [Alphaproteobacteria bacterium]|nr:MAG: MBL fold metallo-hydrolase [Alphaproteobacteria bacterium]TAF12959.1 MAG: MBL fold metallo-hydrolase [Alphaproteobacteria bacterium]TAF39924.1 MAG: MBL fold metallo-hydrolase [Alphaproteobacteria bacterium]TAF77474.1 MAG: MBL fold metallo-hydrolase [Alphaproteobacteria bacterium]